MIGTATHNGSPVSMQLSAVLEGMAVVSPVDEREITGVHVDSRIVSVGSLFIALQGDTVHGLDFIDPLIDSGVVAVLVDSQDQRCTEAVRLKLKNASVVLLDVDELSAQSGVIASRFFGNPSSALKVVGVTGTDGKTSVCHLLGQALNQNRSNCGVLGTLGWGFGDQMQSTGLTTPDAVVLQSALAEMLNAGANTVAMEVSSHSLVQQRVNGIVFDVAVLTNIGRDHLDYHGDMQSYREAKKSLFHKPQLRAAVINTDDEFGAALIEQLPGIDVYSYGSDARSGERDGFHICYSNVVPESTGLSFELQYAAETYQVSCNLLGEFNVSNIAATFTVLVALGISPELAVESLTNLKPVPGRMQATMLEKGAVAIVDYAHNPHALESVLRTVSSHCDGRLFVVFGCGGDRDQGKRPLMAAVAEKFADVSVVTDDNPRSECGDQIVSHILKGFNDRQKVTVERDRKSAIELAITQAVKGDYIVVAGKGHEDYQLVGDQRLPFSDIAVVEQYAGQAL